MKIRETVYVIDREALQRIEERLFELNAPHAIEENEQGIFLRSYDPRVDEFMKSEGFEPIEVKEVDPLDWMKNQLKEPFELVRGVVVDPVGNYKGEEEIILRIPPGMAFGTGIHPTTKLAASFIVDYFKKGMSFLDVGTGSGILSILAAKLGASEVLGIDLDKNAIEVAKDNAELNNVKVKFRLGDLLNDVKKKYDFVVANIVPEVLKKMVNDSRRVMKNTSFLVLSGINKEELQNVLRLYKSVGLKVLEIRRDEDWTAMILKL